MTTLSELLNASNLSAAKKAAYLKIFSEKFGDILSTEDNKLLFRIDHYRKEKNLTSNELGHLLEMHAEWLLTATDAPSNAALKLFLLDPLTFEPFPVDFENAVLTHESLNEKKIQINKRSGAIEWYRDGSPLNAAAQNDIEKLSPKNINLNYLITYQQRCRDYEIIFSSERELITVRGLTYLQDGLDVDFLRAFIIAMKKIDVDWKSQQCESFLLQLQRENMSLEMIQFVSSVTTQTDRKSKLTELQARFQYVLWFGLDERQFTTHFFTQAKKPFVCANMIGWLKNHGALVTPAKTIDNIIEDYCVENSNQENHTTLISIISQCRDELEKATWLSLFTLLDNSSDKTQLQQALMLCKTAMLKSGELSLETWIKNPNDFKTQLIAQLFKNRLLTAAEVMAVFQQKIIAREIPALQEHMNQMKIALSTQLFLKQNTSTVATAPSVEDDEFDIISPEKIALPEGRNASDYIQDKLESIFRGLREKLQFYSGKFDGENPFIRLNALISRGTLLDVYSLLQNPDFRNSAGESKRYSFWNDCCSDAYQEFNKIKKILLWVGHQPEKLSDLILASDKLDAFTISTLMNNHELTNIQMLIKEWIVFARGGYGVNEDIVNAYRREFPEVADGTYPFTLKLIKNRMPLYIILDVIPVSVLLDANLNLKTLNGTTRFLEIFVDENVVPEIHRKEVAYYLLNSHGESNNPCFNAATFVDHFHVMQKKCNAIRNGLDKTIQLLTVGGYTKTGDAIAILKKMRNILNTLQESLNPLDRTYDEFLLDFNKAPQKLVKLLCDGSAALNRLYEPGCTNADSITQPLRALFCYFFSTKAEPLFLTNNEDASDIDGHIKQNQLKLAQFSLIDFETLENSLIQGVNFPVVTTPVQASKLPEPNEHNGDIEYAIRAAAYWIKMHGNYGNTVFKKKTPPLQQALIDTINEADPSALRHFIETHKNEEDRLARDVISCLNRCLSHPILIRQWLTNTPEKNPLITETLITILRDAKKERNLTREQKNALLELEATINAICTNRKPHDLVDLNDAQKLLACLSSRWRSLQKDNDVMPTTYFNDIDNLNLVDRAYAMIAQKLTQQFIFGDEKKSGFKVPAALLMPGSWCDRIIDLQYRQYTLHPDVAERIVGFKFDISRSEEFRGEDPNVMMINPITDISTKNLIFLDSIPLSETYFKESGVRVVRKESAQARDRVDESVDWTLHHPITNEKIAKEDAAKLAELQSCGPAGSSVAARILELPPTERSLHALSKLIHAMVQNDGDHYWYSLSQDIALQMAQADFLATLSTYPETEQQALWNTVIPGQRERATIHDVLGISVERAEIYEERVEECTHGTGRKAALVIHQYFSDANKLLPKDAQSNSDKMKTVGDWNAIGRNKKKPAANDFYLTREATACSEPHALTF